MTTQATLGTIAMTIVYLVLVLRSVRGDAAFHDVPHAAVSLGTRLALACVRRHRPCRPGPRSIQAAAPDMIPALAR